MKDVILIDKPAGWTSFDVVAKIRSRIRADFQKQGIKPTKRQLRVGHAGTLDPFATGLLVILLGDACKQADQYLKLDKTYEFTAKLGEVSSTGDPEGEITQYIKGKKQEVKSETEGVIPGLIRDPVSEFEQSELTSLPHSNIHIPTSSEVLRALEQFTGEITQTPPAFSAIKVNGQRAYKLAREGKAVELPTRKVTVHSLQLIEYNYPYLKCVCEVSSGTYIRTLVEDVGEAIGVGAYCKELRRTRIGDFKIDAAHTIEEYLSQQ